ncbi:hypothetical protein FHR33_001083 [Nonomuraea dietziae]|uniref:Uncharacterized protein n=1 Tax=Nonomuraea dietziae TaxID=65515 RepID=A0A7W5Y5N6_9ACTN|nr:hypothetical protein [Nonomuraea dietziae]
MGIVPVGQELHIRADAQSSDLWQIRAGVEGLDVVPALEHVGDHDAGLGQVRRAGHVGDDTAWPDGVERGGEQAPLERPQRWNAPGRTPPRGRRHHQGCR